MFQRFWRSPTRRESTGLGLSYVRAAAEAHNGTVAVGRAPEGGALVGLRLPTSMVGDLSPMPDKDPPPQLASV
jgi:signal transduction histidine kinase